ncbi:MAG TPA: glycosyltransferase family 1 protein [Allosphingosinicella sp.]|nr:glycosyltransferase family 1 protein [Allosphingosinicella sp.]
MNIQIVTDAWEPQVNGVVRTLRSVTGELRRIGHAPAIIGPDLFASIPCPTYGEIRLALATASAVGRRLEEARADAIHIATEGPLGLAARRWCLRRRLPFTTAYHTQFPDYLAKRTHLPAEWFWRYIRWFHAPSQAILVSTATVGRQLEAHGLPRTRRWSRGVDIDCFRPAAERDGAHDAIARPILLYVGRIAVEKNIQAFLECRHPGSKMLVGDGPDLPLLKRRYPDAAFLGARHGRELADLYAAADVLVFPSRTDTFGLVMIEALACGTPVAAFPVAGPIDVLDAKAGCMDEDLDAAIAGALRRDRSDCTEHARRFTWEQSAREFVEALAPVNWRAPARAAA